MKRKKLLDVFQILSFFPALLLISILCVQSPRDVSAAQLTDDKTSTPQIQAGFFEPEEDFHAYLKPKNCQILEGESFQLAVKGVPKKCKISFKSSDTDVASVTKTSSKKAEVKAISSGTAQITVKISQKRGPFERTLKTLTCNVEVGPKAISIKLKRDSLTMRTGKSKKLSYTLKPNNTAEVPVFESSNPRKLTISAKGKMKAKAPGKVKVTATIAAGKSVTCTVTIRPPKNTKQGK